MELKLGLALPSGCPVSVSSVDVNSFRYEPVLQLGSNWFSCTSTCNENGGDCGGKSKKRCFGEVVEENIKVPQTLPLLLWNNQPNYGDGDRKDLDEASSHVINKNNVRDVEGWPPVKTWRTKKLRRKNYNGGCVRCDVRASNSKMVKVKMEGVAIARKIDLNLYHSFETLTTTLNDMFGNKNRCGYKLAFQDKDGDWLLAEGTPWRTFIASVQRLMLLRIRAVK